MNEDYDIWYEDLFDIGLDEYLHQLFTELDTFVSESNAQNYTIIEE